MDRGRQNLAAARALLAGLRADGLAHVALAPGSRSTPLALALAEISDLAISVHLDERSAAFCALGFARASGRPAALVCTSGSAGANAYGAVIEAWHSRIPLLVLTADRPPELRASGAWQTIDQQRLFGSFLRDFVEAALPGEALDLPAQRYYRDLGSRAARRALGRPPGPVQINLPFREPLAPMAGSDEDPPDPSAPHDLPAPADRGPASRRSPLAARPSPLLAHLAGLLHRSPQGLIVAGLMDAPLLGWQAQDLADAIGRLSLVSGYPLLAEVTSGLRFGPHRRDHLVDGYDAFLRSQAFGSQPPQLVLRFGGSLTWRPVNQYLAAHPQARHLVFDPLDQGDDPARLAADWLTGCGPLEVEALSDAIDALGPRPPSDASVQASWLDRWLQARDLAAASRERAFATAPEGSSLWLHGLLARLLPPHSLLVLANSMAVRDVDSFIGSGPQPLTFMANRGAAGIDGTLSTAVGAALHRHAAGLGPTFLLTGDLAFLHDVNGLGLMGPDRRQSPDLTVVVLDDGGGAIFGYLPVAQQDPQTFLRFFRTDPDADLPAACAAYRIPCQTATGRAEFAQAWAWSLTQPGIRVIVVKLDMAVNQAAHEGYWGG